MTDRHSGYVVVLAEDIREDDSENVLNAIRMIKGVRRVSPVPAEPGKFIVDARVRRELTDKLYALIKDINT